MPNLPVAVRRGVTGLYSPDADERTREQLNNLFTALGFAMWMADEAKLAALGSVAGAGPAYVARFIAALAKAGEKRGLSAEIAAVIARETVLGTAWMAASTGEDMQSVARRVASPNGTTEAGLKVLDRDEVLDELVAVTIEAAARRGAELADEARGLAVELGSNRAAPRLPRKRVWPRRRRWLHLPKQRSTTATAGSGSMVGWCRGAMPACTC